MQVTPYQHCSKDMVYISDQEKFCGSWLTLQVACLIKLQWQLRCTQYMVSYVYTAQIQAKQNLYNIFTA